MQINDKVVIIDTDGVFCGVGDVGVIVGIKYRHSKKRYEVRFMDCYQDCKESNIRLASNEEVSNYGYIK